MCAGSWRESQQPSCGLLVFVDTLRSLVEAQSRYVQCLTEFHTLSGVCKVLVKESTQRVPAALCGLAVFVDTLRLLVEAQQANTAAAHTSPNRPDAAEGGDSPTPMEEDAQGGSPVKVPEGSLSGNGAHCHNRFSIQTHFE